MNTLHFLFIFYLFLMSAVGHGYLYKRILNINFHDDLGTLGILGLINLTLISYILALLINEKIYLNLIIHFLGIIIFVLNLKKFKVNKYSIIIISILSIGIFISKTHDDFSFYHLPQSLNLSINKLQIGLSNLDFSYAYHSSVLYLNSLFYLPIYKYFFFNVPNLLFFIFSSLIFIKNILDNKNIKIIRFYSLFVLSFILIKFSRLSEFGTDLSGQILILVSILYFLKFINYKIENNAGIIIFFTILLYCFTIKTYFIFYLFLFFLIFIFKNRKNVKPIFSKNINFLGYSVVYLFLFFTINLFSSGCLIFPIALSCIEDLSWSMPIEEVKGYSQWFEVWSKSLAGTNYIENNYLQLTNNFLWINFWVKNYLPKYLETIYLLFFLVITFLLLFRDYTRSRIKLEKNSKLIIFFLIFIFLFWFYKHPTLRYGGFAVHIAIISILLSNYLDKTLLNEKKIFKNSIIIISISLFVFFAKNTLRINNEFNRDDQFKFNNFPYFKVVNVNYERITVNNNFLFSYVYGSHCWDSPPPCGTIKNLNVDRINGYYLIKRKN